MMYPLNSDSGTMANRSAVSLNLETMKKILILSAALFFSLSFFTECFSQMNRLYKVNSKKVLARQGGYAYTEGHFQKGLRFVEFLVDQRITPAEIQAGREESLDEFRKDPASTVQQTDYVDQQMQQVYALTDPVQIALVRSAFLAQFQNMFNQTNEQPVIRQLIDKYCPVLAFDPYNSVAFTRKDFDGMINLMKFQAELSGQPFNLDDATYQQYMAYFTQQFLSGTLEIRQSMAVMGVLSEYLTSYYAMLNENQRQQFKQQMLAGMYPANQQNSYDVTWPDGVNTPEEKQAYLMEQQQNMQFDQQFFNTYSNMLLEQHASILNVIENMGGGDSYWEVKYNDW